MAMINMQLLYTDLCSFVKCELLYAYILQFLIVPYYRTVYIYDIITTDLNRRFKYACNICHMYYGLSAKKDFKLIRFSFINVS